MAVLVVVAIALVIVVAVGGWQLYQRSVGAAPTATPLADLVRQAESLPPSPTRTVVRLRVELWESAEAAEAATIAARGTATDLTATSARLRALTEGVDADLAALSARSDAAIGPLVPALRTRVREAQAVADRLVVLARDAAAGAARSELERLHDDLDHELRVIDAHRELDEE
ncbi:MAG: hypothetical protein AAFZ07_21710 [Actinomycetota bacterium]